jgi:hypothetical protein
MPGISVHAAHHAMSTVEPSSRAGAALVIALVLPNTMSLT